MSQNVKITIVGAHAKPRIAGSIPTIQQLHHIKLPVIDVEAERALIRLVAGVALDPHLACGAHQSLSYTPFPPESQAPETGSSDRGGRGKTGEVFAVKQVLDRSERTEP